MRLRSIGYPQLETPREVADWLGVRPSAPHAVILKVVTPNICGSDQHMLLGRTTAPVGQPLGHEILGEPEVDADVDAVGFEARGHGADAEEAPATVLNDMMAVARVGAGLGIPGLYVTGDPGAAKKYVIAPPHGMTT